LARKIRRGVIEGRNILIDLRQNEATLQQRHDRKGAISGIDTADAARQILDAIVEELLDLLMKQGRQSPDSAPSIPARHMPPVLCRASRKARR
jgi:hypothetical protein